MSHNHPVNGNSIANKGGREGTEPPVELVDDGVPEEVEYIGGIIKRISNFSIGTLEERKIFQKTVYLIQAFDIYLGYDDFNWYLYGVYSPTLADHGYQLAEVYDEIDERRFTDPEKERRFTEFLEFVEDMKYDVTTLEASSSIHYIWERNPNADRDMIIEFVVDQKDLGDDGVALCEREWHRLQSYNVI